MLTFHGLDPECVRIVGEASMSRWTTSRWNKESSEVETIWNTAHKFRIESIRDDIEFDLSGAFALAEVGVTAYTGVTSSSDTYGVLVVSDAQVGKVDRRGGTQELLDRAEYVRQWFEAHAGSRNLAGAIVAEPGDLVEGEWSAGGLNTLLQNDIASPMK